MSRYEYIDRPPGSAWLVEVRKGSSLKGNIRRSPVTGRYQFFRGAANVIRPSLEESSLSELKEKIDELTF